MKTMHTLSGATPSLHTDCSNFITNEANYLCLIFFSFFRNEYFTKHRYITAPFHMDFSFLQKCKIMVSYKIFQLLVFLSEKSIKNELLAHKYTKTWK
jgi:hypothetical protein